MKKEKEKKKNISVKFFMNSSRKSNIRNIKLMIKIKHQRILIMKGKKKQGEEICIGTMML